MLLRFGAFTKAEIDRVVQSVPKLLEPASINRSGSIPEMDVSLCEAGGTRKAKLRFILFATEQQRGSSAAVCPYVFENDIMQFVWRCFRPEKQRQLCDVRYNFELWGPQFVQLVKYFKDTSRTASGTIQDIYRYFGV